MEEAHAHAHAHHHHQAAVVPAPGTAAVLPQQYFQNQQTTGHV